MLLFVGAQCAPYHYLARAGRSGKLSRAADQSFTLERF